MKNKIFFSLILLIVFIALVTNPDLKKHQDAVGVRFKEYVHKKINEHTSNKLGLSLGTLFSETIEHNLIPQIVSSDNYHVCSFTKIKWDGEEYTVGIGVLGTVYIYPNAEKVIEEGINDYFEQK
ncbi:MAG: hypothetical protein U0V72_11085 [Cytophagales bacterium]